jgi:hypothetical protein
MMPMTHDQQWAVTPKFLPPEPLPPATEQKLDICLMGVPYIQKNGRPLEILRRQSRAVL